MAASGEQKALGQLGQEATCPLCLDFFKHPMGLSCGHNFCRDCLAQLGPEFSCPQCRAKVEPGSAYPNLPLANIVGHLKSCQLLEGAQEESSSQRLCQEHGQPLQIFCSNEKSLLCLGCLGRHQAHPLLSVREAAQQYKDLLDGHLKSLRMKEQKLLEQRQVEELAEEQSWQECQEQFATEKQQVGLALESLQELLRKRQSGWLAWLAEQEEKMEAEWSIPLTQLSGEASRLQQLIVQTEEKCRQPDGELLQDIQDTIDRCKRYTMGHVENVSPRLQGRLRTLLEKSASVRQVVDSFKASLHPILTREDLEQPLNTGLLPQVSQTPRSSKVFVTLNRTTAQRPSLTLADGYQECLHAPERFNQEFCVLGCEGFTTGLHWWEVSVEEPNSSQWARAACWAIGVAKDSICRKNGFRLNPQEGIWALGKSFGREILAFSHVKEKLRLQSPLQRLQVRLDCETGKVEFLDGKSEASLYTFQTGPLLGETLRPFFYLGQKGVAL